MPRMEWRLDVGHVLTIVTVMVGLAVAWGGNQTQLRVLEMRMQEHSDSNRQLVERMARMQDDIWQLRIELKQMQAAKGVAK